MGRHLIGLADREGAMGTTKTPLDLGHHEPVGRGLGRVEERVAHPHLDDVLDTQARVFEQMGGLSIDLEGAPIVEKIEIK